jgi:hypothetical protein
MYNALLEVIREGIPNIIECLGIEAEGVGKELVWK